MIRDVNVLPFILFSVNFTDNQPHQGGNMLTTQFWVSTGFLATLHRAAPVLPLAS